MKILTVVGARPQFIKAAAISRAIAKHPEITEVIVHTGQHFDANMSEVFFSEMNIPHPKYNLGIASKTHGAMTGEMLSAIEGLCLTEKPEIVLVFGDTNSTLAGALAAAKLHIRVAHVEAGLRSFNMRMPEEINRILTDRISNLLFCPTETAVENLRLEGFGKFPAQIFKTGDVMYDTAMYYSKFAPARATIFNTLSAKMDLQNFALCTIHRAENTDSEAHLRSIFAALREIAKQMPVILPLHPRTRKFLQTYNIPTGEVKILEPVGYFDMIELLQKTALVLTDSGGLQKEAYFFDKPCLTMREETEWTELVSAGQNTLTGVATEKILASFKAALLKKPTWEKGLYGNGHSSEEIVGHLLGKGK